MIRFEIFRSQVPECSSIRLTKHTHREVVPEPSCMRMAAGNQRPSWPLLIHAADAGSCSVRSELW
jgi:hypothetical protein